MSNKFCTKCKELKDVSYFHKCSKAKDGLLWQCKACAIKYRQKWYKINKESVIKLTKLWVKNNIGRQKEYTNKYRLKKLYGLTPKERANMETAQKGLCAICIKRPSKKGLCVDHNHVTDKVRGLLCVSCNFTLGLIKDDLSILNSMLEYLKIGG